MPPRFLRPNHAEQMPSLCCVVDTETVPPPGYPGHGPCVHQFRLGVAICWRRERGRSTRREVYPFTDLAAFWTWTRSRLVPRKVLYCWAHNLGYDLTSLQFWQQLEDGSFTLTRPPPRKSAGAAGNRALGQRQGVVCTEDAPTIVECWDRQGRKLVLLDTLNWWRCRLEDLAPEVGLAKVPLPDFADPDAAWWERCTSDALILERCVNELLDWLRATRAGNFRYTLSGQAMSSWRHLYDGVPVSLGDDLEAKAWARGALYQARQWCHWAGVVDDPAHGPFVPADPVRHEPLPHRPGPVHVLDVRGCYPHVMRDRLYPREHIRTEERCTVAELARGLRVHGAIAEVELDSPHEPYPLRRGARVHWCTGRYWTRLCGPELCAALQAGHVVTVGMVQWYSLADLFTDWVGHWWAERQRQREAGRPLWERATKGILNGLHGKWGERSHTWEAAPGVPSPAPWGQFHRPGPGPGQVDSYRALAHHAQRRGARAETLDGSPAITAWVHAAARLHLRQLAHVAGDDGLIWCDCDQLCVDDVGLARLRAHPGLVGDGLGQLKLQWSEPSGRIEGVRSYRLGARCVTQGISRRAVPQPDGSYRQDEFARLDALLSSRPPPGPVVSRAVKSAPLPQVGGVQIEGGYYRPWRVEEVPDGPGA